ncbi:MAG TPA: hypothetical protein VIF14_11160 [Alphaproteobacteria bacterium]|jgi:hypothetical protein
MRTLRPLLILGAIGTAVPAQAQNAAATPDTGPAICARYELHTRYLADKFGEFPLFSGAAGDGIALQLFINRSTGSWTALLVRGDGFSCITSAGESGRQEVGL